MAKSLQNGWKSTKWWIISAAVALLKWLKEQMKGTSVIVRLVNDVMQFMSFMLITNERTLKPVGPAAIPKKNVHKKKKKRR